MKKKVSPFFKFFKKILKFFYPTAKFYGTENIPDEPVVFVGNHSQIHGPLICELFFPAERYTWCEGQMMKLKEVPSYAFQDFWSQKSKYTQPFYKIVSYLIAPLSVFVFNNANTVAVYKDARGITTYKESMKLLEKGYHLVIFPEHDVKYNNIIYDYQDKFIDLARLYYKKYKKELSFVPMYIAPKLKEVHLGKPIRYSADSNPDTERERIKAYLMDEITSIARELPCHTVVPYRNIPKRLYPKNKES